VKLAVDLKLVDLPLLSMPLQTPSSGPQNRGSARLAARVPLMSASKWAIPDGECSARVLTYSLKYPDHGVDETTDDGRDWLHDPPKLATRSRARVPFRTACSDGETEHAEEYKHLWGDTVYGAVDDADDGDRKATRNV